MKKKKEKIVRVKRRYMLVTGFNTYKWVVVYTDYSVSIGCEQKLNVGSHLIEAVVLT